MSTSSFTPLVFTGISTFSSDFQTVLKRAVSIASLPLKQLQNDDADILQKKTLLGSLSAAVSAFGASVAGLGTVSQNKALFASSSDSTVVTVQNTGATAPATYAISDITSIASAASETSLVGYANSSTTPVSSVGKLKLVIGTNEPEITLTPATNNLVGVRDAINDLGVGVTASILTTGTGPNSNYLSLTSSTSGETTLQLLDDPDGTPTNLLSSANQGSNLEFKLNGVNVSKSSNAVTDVVSGATFTILKTTAVNQTVTLSLATDRNQLKNAITDFVGKYNSLLDQVGSQVGPAAGLLTGDFIVREVQNDLRKVTSYEGSGDIQHLSDLGIQSSADGKLTFDTNVFASLSDSQITSAFTFFGSATTGLGALADKFTQISDPISGLIKLEQDSFDEADRRIQSNIDDLNLRVSQLQASIAAQLQAADALQAQLASQQQLLTSVVRSLNYTSFGKPTDSSSA